MKRALEKTLTEWKNSDSHKPIILKGARQVGKSFLVRQFGRSFDNFVELNFDYSKEFNSIFEMDLDPQRIIKEISILKSQKIVPGRTLLLFDEIQDCPNAIRSLRYFYEMMPELHVIAAGSLLEFALEKIGLPVGRVMPLHLYPMSFEEFATARNSGELLSESANYFPDEIPLMFHTRLLKLFGEYIAVGGMPEVVSSWISNNDIQKCRTIQNGLIEVYKTDFLKYAKKHQIKYVDILYSSISSEVGRKFVYSSVGADYKSRELKPALELLCKADVIHQIFHSSVSVPPLKSGEKNDFFKVIMSDIGLMQAMMNSDVTKWIIDPEEATKNNGAVIEAFVGQEILACSPAEKKSELFYWARTKRGACAEIDYLIEINDTVIPIEVKAGKSTKLTSLEIYLKEKPSVKYGIHLSQLNNDQRNNIKTVPLYLTNHVVKAPISSKRL
ncbi:MAG TPA: AAA family ATPase [bacterium]|nr:AAA family ATPase [bacterium]